MASLDYSRTDRIADFIKREVAQLITYSVRDPRLEGLTVHEVSVNKDLSHAKLFVSLLGESVSASDQDKQQAMDALKKASGFFRSELAKISDLRQTPKLTFIYDELPQKAQALESLIQSALNKPK